MFVTSIKTGNICKKKKDEWSNIWDIMPVQLFEHLDSGDSYFTALGGT